MSQTVFMACVVLVIVAAAAAVLVFIVASVSPHTRAWLLLGLPLAARRARNAWRKRKQRARGRHERRTAADTYDMEWLADQDERHDARAVAVHYAPAWATEAGYDAQRALWEARTSAAAAGPIPVVPGPFDLPEPRLDLREPTEGEMAELELRLRAALDDPAPVVQLLETFGDGKQSLRDVYGPAYDELPATAEEALAEVRSAAAVEHQGATEEWSPLAEIGRDERPVKLAGHLPLDPEDQAILDALDAVVEDLTIVPPWLVELGAAVDEAFRRAEHPLAEVHAAWRAGAHDVPSGAYAQLDPVS